MVLRLVDDDVAVGADLRVDAAAAFDARPEQVVGRVEQRHVGVAPFVADGFGARPREGRLLGVVEQAVAGRTQQRRRPEQVAQQLVGGQHRPHPVERRDDVGMLGQALADEIGRRGFGEVRGEGGGEGSGAAAGRAVGGSGRAVGSGRGAGDVAGAPAAPTPAAGHPRSRGRQTL
ncbi:MAG TPA: hypothetical protein DEP69_05885, partial [Acidimicrobiaceae bacterium]|nr:hypothetical protein [Acidimicrobiaceae bacterium]